jgi:hypothetical protein
MISLPQSRCGLAPAADCRQTHLALAAADISIAAPVRQTTVQDPVAVDKPGPVLEKDKPGA